MVVGVSDGFSKIQELVGTGFRATSAGKELTLNVGYCKPRVLVIPDGLKVTVSDRAAAWLGGQKGAYVMERHEDCNCT